jgi:PAS domain S-box-containing protein
MRDGVKQRLSSTALGRRPSPAVLGLLVGLGIVTAMAAFAYRHMASLDEMERWVAHTHDVLDATHAIVISVGDAGRARRAFAVTRDEAELEPYQRAVAHVNGLRSELHVLTADNLAQQRRVDELDAMVAARLDQLSAAIRDSRARPFDARSEASLTDAAVVLISRLGARAGELEATERRLLDERSAASRAESASVRRTMVLGFGASVVILLLAFLLSHREVLRRRRSEAALAERERDLAATLGSIGDGVIATDAAGVITRMNRVAEELTGWRLTEAAGTPFAEVFRIIGEHTRAPEPDPVARVLAERVGVGLANHTVLIARDGTERSIADSAAPIVDERNALYGVVIVFRDVSVAKSVEARFQRLVEAAPDAIVIADGEGKITIVNHQTSALFGYPAGELIGQPVEMLIPERLRERHVEHRRGFHAAPAVRSMGSGLQLLAHRKDGTVCPVEVSLSPFHAPDGPHVIAAVRDVTRRRELERFRDEYVGYISHDLKNPLSVIVLQVRMLTRWLDGRASSDEQRALGVIAESTAFIEHLVRELLEMAYVESDEIVLHREPVELAGLLTSVLERAVSSSDRDRVRLEIVEPSTVTAEPPRIERVIVNLVQNAIKYSPPGSPIRVRLEAVGDRAVVSVIDAGPGVAPEERATVFDKYKRATSAGIKEGLGLGLYISRKIIEAHGGEIGVGGAPGQGATFFIRLPHTAAVPKPATPRAAPPRRDELRGRKVLLVDDEVNAISALAVLLDDEGLDIASATSGEQALTLADSRWPDVAVLDVQMPGMDGLMVLERLRQKDPGLPAVIMTGHLEIHAGIAEARARGGVTYVGKPVNVDELLRAIERVCVRPDASAPLQPVI